MKINNQNGAATLLIVIVIGILMSVSVLSVISNQKSTQQKIIANHAQVASQVGAWKGVELFRHYLFELTDEQIVEIVGDKFVFEVSGVQYNIEVELFNTTYRHVNVISTFKDQNAKSSASVSAQLRLKEKGSGNYFEGQQAFLIGDLNSTGRVEMDSDGESKLLIDGDVTNQSIQLLGLDVINATGTVSFSSAENIDSIYANDNVTLTGGAIVNTVKSLKNITATGGTAITTAVANGNIDYSTSGASDSLSAIGTITVAGGSNVSNGVDESIVGLVHSNSDVFITNKNTINNIRVMGDVEVKSPITTSRFVSEGEVTCPYYSQIKITNTLQSNENIDSQCQISDQNLVFEGQSNIVTPVELLNPLTIDKPTVDVWKVREYANFQFLHDNSSGQITVEVKDMKGLDDGTYFIKNLTNEMGAQELCTDQSLNNCTGKKLCDGYSSACVQLSSKNNKDNSTWSINAHQMASGVYFFDGNVKLKLPYSNISVLAAGDIETNDKVVLKSMNYSTYDELCLNDFVSTYEINRDPVEYENFSPRANSNITGFYPTNYCDDANQVLKNDVLGNTALLSGGIRDDVDASNQEFTGGDISLKNLSVLMGSVLAGDNLYTGGLAIIYGYLVTLDNVDDREYDANGNLISGDENVFSANVSIINDENMTDGFYGQLMPILECSDEDDKDSCVFNNDDTSDFDAVGEKTDNGIKISNAKYL